VVVEAAVVEEAEAVEAEGVCDIQVHDQVRAHQVDHARVHVRPRDHQVDLAKGNHPDVPVHARVNRPGEPAGKRDPVVDDPVVDDPVQDNFPVAEIGLVVEIDLEQVDPVVAGPVEELVPATDLPVVTMVVGSITVATIAAVIIVVTTTVGTTDTGETPAAIGTDIEQSIT